MRHCLEDHLYWSTLLKQCLEAVLTAVNSAAFDMDSGFTGNSNVKLLLQACIFKADSDLQVVI